MCVSVVECFINHVSVLFLFLSVIVLLFPDVDFCFLNPDFFFPDRFLSLERSFLFPFFFSVAVTPLKLICYWLFVCCCVFSSFIIFFFFFHSDFLIFLPVSVVLFVALCTHSFPTAVNSFQSLLLRCKFLYCYVRILFVCSCVTKLVLLHC